ncbi:MAG: translation elongation factor Ts [Candidatus Pacebacteria bacterium]|nr:translation elongation factor Ts [Candidatus Paceibacterota bacterium]
MAITTEQIKELRDLTGISIMQCKKALEEAGGDKEKALVLLRQKGADIAAKKGDRTLGAGAIAAYIHSTGTIGAMVELVSETDFVSKNEEFKKLAYDIAMQVSATSPVESEALLEQPFIKNPDLTIAQLIESAIQKFGEKIQVERFVRFGVLEK